ncbi:hypothetical protein ACVCAH_36615 [Micromonospora sp. LZ34]
MPVDDQAHRPAATAQHALDRGYEVTAVASAAVALRMVVDGHADVIVAVSLDDLPEIEVADAPRLKPRPRTAPDVVPRAGAAPPTLPRCDTRRT